MTAKTSKGEYFVYKTNFYNYFNR